MKDRMANSEPISLGSGNGIAEPDRFGLESNTSLPSTPENTTRRFRVSRENLGASSFSTPASAVIPPSPTVSGLVPAGVVETSRQVQPFSQERRHSSIQGNVHNVSQNASDQIILDVGGTVHKTTESTLCKDQQSMLAAMVRNRRPDNHKIFFIDRDGLRFRDVLNYLRVGKVHLEDVTSLRELYDEAEFFGLSSLQAVCMEKLQEIDTKSSKKQEERNQLQTESMQQLAATVQGYIDTIVDLAFDRPNKSRRVDAAEQQHVFRMDEEF